MNKKCEIVAGKETFFAIQFSMFDPRVPSERYRMREAYPPPRTSEKYLLTQESRTRKVHGKSCVNTLYYLYRVTAKQYRVDNL